MRHLSLPAILITSLSLVGYAQPAASQPATTQAARIDVAPFATVATSYVSPHETLTGVNAGYTPKNSNDKSHGAYGNWPKTGTQWIELDWEKPIASNAAAVYWFDDQKGVRLPHAARLLAWDGSAFAPVETAAPPGLIANAFANVAFKEITTTKMRLEMDGAGPSSTGVLAWRVYDSGNSSHFPPMITPVVDREVVITGKTYLGTKVKALGSDLKTVWSKESGPGEVTFDDAGKAKTAARFSAPGDYQLKLSVTDVDATSTSSFHAYVIPAPPAEHLSAVWASPYTINSRFWQPRLKAQIVHWIPYCFAKLNDPKVPEGGIQNFIEAANKLANKPAAKHVGFPWANAYLLNTLESMCLAQLVDPAGDAEIAAAQKDLKIKIDQWIPLVLAAQEPDGYLHTLTTISGRKRWSDKSLHEGYTDGYFIDAAMAHFIMSGRTDRRLYDAAKKMADCWYDHIGPAPKQKWYDGHETIEQTLLRFARLVNETDGPGSGDHYVALAKFLIDSRGTIGTGGSSYDQSHLPMVQQYTAEGHAVRAAYIYSALSGIAMATNEPDYQSAAASVWDNLVNRKYYLTGGIGSGDTSEGFGGDYHLGNNAYCESCADCGEIFFQQNMLLANHHARYADLYEETLYNAVLGSVDLDGKNFTYTNPLDSSQSRYRWHDCPCCVGNIPRTLLDLPRWTYAVDANDLYVNLFIGGTMNAGKIAGQNVKVTQETDYPWNGKVKLTVNPTATAKFAVHVRVPNRQTSTLYTPSPSWDGIQSLSVNGAAVEPSMNDGYAVIDREWKAGDAIEFELPLGWQKVVSSSEIKGNVNRVALRYGPLVYNIETADDQSMDAVLPITAALKTQFDDNLLGGVMTITGKFADGTPMKAVPNYARLNRGGRSIVWIRDK